MKPLLAIIKLTWRAAFRYRLIWVLLAMLLAAAVVLPKVVRHDETATGFTQIVMTYTLGSILVLLGVATLWLSCGTLARDIEECQMQMVAVKPVPRWKIWLGKWLGIVTLNLALLAVAGAAVFALLQWRARELPGDQLQRLRQEVLVARASLKEPVKDYRPQVAAAIKAWRKDHAGPLTQEDIAAVYRQIEEMVKAPDQVREPGTHRTWEIEAKGLRERLVNKPLYIRTKLYLPQNRPGVIVGGIWGFGPLMAPVLVTNIPMAPEAIQEFTVPASVIGDNGKLLIHFFNRNDTAVVFLLDDGMEVLYRESSFAVNFVRGLLILLLWLALLAAMGLAASSFLSFPVASFCSLALMVILLFSGSMTTAVEEGTVMGRNHETGQVDMPLVDTLMLPMFKGILGVVNLAKSYSPIDSLSTGRSITWGTLGWALLTVSGLLSGVFALLGIVTFTRRELAAVQMTS